MFDSALEILATIEMLRATRGAKFSFVIVYEADLIVLKYVVVTAEKKERNEIVLNMPNSFIQAIEHSNNLRNLFV